MTFGGDVASFHRIATSKDSVLVGVFSKEKPTKSGNLTIGIAGAPCRKGSAGISSSLILLDRRCRPVAAGDVRAIVPVTARRRDEHGRRIIFPVPYSNRRQ